MNHHHNLITMSMIISSSSSHESLKLIEMTYGQSNTNNTNANPAVNFYY
jgi:hypothetical protein